MAKPQSSGFLAPLKVQRNVISAVMLRDMRTRFFNHGLGFLGVTAWPLAHMIILLTIYHFRGTTSPFGESLDLFFATGLFPTLTFIYISRFMSLSLVLNKPMLAFPVVTVLDVMIARATLEIIASFLTLILFVVYLTLIGQAPVPYDPLQAVACYLATILLALGIGSLAGVVVMFFEFFVTIYALLAVIFYLSSGTLFIASALPDELSHPLSWSPLTQCVEWMRTAYFPTYSDKLVDKFYVVEFGFCSLCLGLTLERLFRRQVLEG